LKRLFAFLPLAALVLLAIVFAGWSLKRDPHVQPHALVGKPAPTIALATLDGGAPITTREGADGPFLINFFASWCGPCAIEHPTLMALKAQGVRVVGVAYRDKPDASNAFIARLGDPFALKLSDPEGRAGIEYGITGVPETYLVGSDGVIIDKISAPMTVEDAQKLLRKAR
jgi:cytochrome c biogenesis protein CcmG/thiol:disulfide interchange protein DsbE